MKSKRRLAANIMKISPKKIKFSVDALDEIKKAITRSDIRGLIAVKKISVKLKNEHSRAGARKNASQKRKGRQRGAGSIKGKKFAITTRKERWMDKIRTQRAFLKELKESGIVSFPNFRKLYSKSSGGFFRNKRHIKLFIADQGLAEQKTNQLKK